MASTCLYDLPAAPGHAADEEVGVQAAAGQSVVHLHRVNDRLSSGQADFTAVPDLESHGVVEVFPSCF